GPRRIGARCGQGRQDESHRLAHNGGAWQTKALADQRADRRPPAGAGWKLVLALRGSRRRVRPSVLLGAKRSEGWPFDMYEVGKRAEFDGVKLAGWRILD